MPPLPLSRRQLLGLPLSLAVPLAACATAPALAPAPAPALGSFTHGVASGDPDQTSLLLWTRYQAQAGGAVPLHWQVAADPGFTQPLAQGMVLADPARDCCAKAIATGLPVDAQVYYRFRAPDGQVSATGRGRTLPGPDSLRPLRLAVFSCANIGFGRFNAYAHAAARDDLDLVLHLGDYIYELGDQVYPSPAQRAPGREGLQPPHEIVALADYRRRYAFYRADADLQALHARHSMMAVWDDHEFANDTWRGGAQNHQPATEGEWSIRRDAARQAYYEWLPLRDAPQLYRQVKLGGLADLTLLDTRLVGRDHQASVPRILYDGAVDSPDYAQALARYRAEIEKPGRQLLGATQQAWLDQALAASQQRGARWQLLGQQIVFGQRFFPTDITALLPDTASANLRRVVQRRADLAAQGIATTPDSWPGYVAARNHLLARATEPGRRVLLLAGDTHNAWGFAHAGPAGRMMAEFATPAVCSPGLELSLPGVAPARLAEGMCRASPGLLWCDTARRGYLSLHLTADQARATWHLLADIRAPGLALAAEPSLVARATPDSLTVTPSASA